MTSEYELILEEFYSDLEAIESLVVSSTTPSYDAKIRVAACNSAILLIAATFEEFSRQMAKEYSKFELSKIVKYPEKMANLVWRRTIDELSKIKFSSSSSTNAAIEENSRLIVDAVAKLQIASDFCKGDWEKSIHHHLVHNERNMRPDQFKEIFAISNISNLPLLLCSTLVLKNYFQEENETKNLDLLKQKWENFFETRNAIAHSLNPSSSIGSADVIVYINFWKNVGEAIKESILTLIASYQAEVAQRAAERAAHEQARLAAEARRQAQNV